MQLIKIFNRKNSKNLKIDFMLIIKHLNKISNKKNLF